MSLGKLDGWVAANLLSADQAAAIRAHEAAQGRPWLQWAAFGLGGLAILLGIAALIGSNWETIPGSVKLAVHLAINIAAALAVWAAWRAGKPLWLDLSLFLFAGTILTGIALIGQVFQLSSPLWRPLLLWWIIASPALLVFGQGRLTALAWSIMTFWLGLELVDRFGAALQATPALIALPGSAPALIATLAVLAQRHSSRRRFFADIVAAGLGVCLLGASVAPLLAWYSGVGEQYAWADRFWSYGPWLWLLVGGCLVWLWRQASDSHYLARVLLACLIAVSLPQLLPAADTAGQVLAALLFSALWGFVAFTAGRTQHNGLFKLAVGLIALRLIIVYFEVFGDLASTGLGLILSGLIVLGISWATSQVVRR